MEQQRRLGDGNTTLQLKDDIDSGRTGDKNVTADPGMASLGTCDEAAGTSPTPERVALARKQEKAIGKIATANDKPENNGSIKLLIGAIVLIAVVVVVAFYFAR